MLVLLLALLLAAVPACILSDVMPFSLSLGVAIRADYIAGMIAIPGLIATSVFSNGVVEQKTIPLVFIVNWIFYGLAFYGLSLLSRRQDG